MEILGLDIGGSGIKGAIVNTLTGELLTVRHRIPTPQPSTPESIAATVRQLVDFFQWKGTVGCSFPAVVRHQKSKTTGNLASAWKDIKLAEYFQQACPGTRFYVGNDADLAGIAEMTLGAGKGLSGKVVMVTVGTGIGSGLFYNSVLIPNFEFGQILHPNGEIIERFAADSARKREGLSLREWAERFSYFLDMVDLICSPGHFILGGGISKKFEKYKDYLATPTPILPARFRNKAGIIGAAIFAENSEKGVKYYPSAPEL